MTWEAVAKIILEQMTEEERRGEVKYIEPYDTFSVHTPTLQRATQTEYDPDAEVEIQEGEWFLG